jgi:hypothetical protein
MDQNAKLGYFIWIISVYCLDIIICKLKALSITWHQHLNAWWKMQLFFICKSYKLQQVKRIQLLTNLETKETNFVFVIDVSS